MGRNAKNVALHLAEGNPNRLTKAEIERRKEAEIKIGNKMILASDMVMADQVALQKFQHLKSIYKGIEFVGAADETLINRYCLTFSQYQQLLEFKIKGKNGRKKLTLDEVLKLDSRIDKKQELLVKMEDRLFLNPVARLKNVPKKEKKKPTNPMEKEFDV